MNQQEIYDEIVHIMYTDTLLCIFIFNFIFRGLIIQK